MKKFLFLAAGSMLGLALALPPVSVAKAAELKVLAGGSMTAVLNELGPQFERTSGHKLVIQFDSTPNLIKKINSEPFDLGIVPVDVFRDTTAAAHFIRPAVSIAHVGYGIAVRAGAPKPDVSTREALKKTLLDAKSIAFVPTSAAGSYISNVFERLGIGEAMKAKTKPQATTGQISEAVARGDAELGVFLVNVLKAPGVDLAGPFPIELQQELVFTAAVAADSKEAAGARALINYLTSQEAIAVIRKLGLSPG
jgi:molybdate transport system substrate-binding protein